MDKSREERELKGQCWTGGGGRKAGGVDGKRETQEIAGGSLVSREATACLVGGMSVFGVQQTDPRHPLIQHRQPAMNENSRQKLPQATLRGRGGPAQDRAGGGGNPSKVIQYECCVSLDCPRVDFFFFWSLFIFRPEVKRLPDKPREVTCCKWEQRASTKCFLGPAGSYTTTFGTLIV